jgi:hypothetical protein
VGFALSPGPNSHGITKINARGLRDRLNSCPSAVIAFILAQRAPVSCSFPGEQHPLSFRPPTIATQSAGLPNHSVTRDQITDRIGAHRGADCPGSATGFDGSRQAAITRHCTRGNLQQGTPHPRLERGRAHPRAQPCRRAAGGMPLRGENRRGVPCCDRVRPTQGGLRPFDLQLRASLVL